MCGNKRISLEKLRRIHCLLCQISKTINEAYGVQNLVELTSCFVTTVFFTYYVFVIFLDAHTQWGAHDLYVDVHMTVAWIIPNAWRVCSLAYSSEMVVREASCTEQMVDKLMLLPVLGDYRRCKELQVFAKQLALGNVSYSAAGLVTMNLGMLKSFIATVATYMIILIQFALPNASGQ
ncbi:gustatory receptor for sugar taste 43a-like [Schistocerca gregaria]|uniref:gustatory receptor for sugar taste 43a-like n=1 Tax=Schistocerca gregaria TaxID=7010 RepID=UPI00211EF057|nr:gustatory receptor for sugar taste 43a-like [Schistocerca gregaria]